MDEKGTLMQINELVQFNKIEHSYKLLSEEGPPHERVFKVRLNLGDEVYEGNGISKKEAQKNAASIALENTWYNKPPVVTYSRGPEKETTINVPPTVKLNNIATPLGISVTYELVRNIHTKEISYGLDINSEKLDKLNNSFNELKQIADEIGKSRGPFTVKVSVDDEVFYGFGNSNQEARHDGALKAIEHMKEKIRLRQNSCLREGWEEECKQQRESKKNPVSKIYEAGQKHKLKVSFDVIKDSGPSHKKTFVIRCTLGDFKTEGEGNSKKEATNMAAEKMLSNLSILSDGTDDTDDIINGLKNKKKKNNKKKNVLKEIETDTDDRNGYGLDSITDSLMGLIRSDENTKQETNLKDSSGSNTKGIDKFKAKNMLLQAAKLLNFDITFHDVGKGSNHASSSSLLSLNVKPPYICLGEGATSDDSTEKAALEGLKLLRQNGLEDKLGNINQNVELKTLLENIHDLLQNQKENQYQNPVEK